ncbi:MAG: hypothetical protein IIC35_07260, partial [Gemmatimonadetes bacterium]|nr:hypothetical protein [Gemmatimonadota bacterium]
MTRPTASALALMVLAFATSGIEAQDRPTLSPDDFDQWERLGQAVLSPNGEWLAVSINRVS